MKKFNKHRHVLKLEFKTIRIAMVLITSSLFTVYTFAQENKNQISFSLGPCFAIGDLGDKSADNISSGNANIGTNLYFYYRHKFTANIGLGIKWFSSTNHIDEASIANELNSSSDYDWSAKTSYWSSRGLLSGITAHIPYKEIFVFDFRFLGGYIELSSPEYSLFIQENLVHGSLMKNSSTSAAFGYNIGVGFSYYFTPKWNFNINLDYIGADFNYDFNNGVGFAFSTEQSSFDIQSLETLFANFKKSNERQSFDILNATIGIGYNF